MLQYSKTVSTRLQATLLVLLDILSLLQRVHPFSLSPFRCRLRFRSLLSKIKILRDLATTFRRLLLCDPKVRGFESMTQAKMSPGFPSSIIPPLFSPMRGRLTVWANRPKRRRKPVAAPWNVPVIRISRIRHGIENIFCRGMGSN
ncbi:hypothetical protein F5146DRAFT_1012208 [Armillaria mellea]|nr:hypothetical protein F5146DRAFT_1012208 [Armillaria mellea]